MEDTHHVRIVDGLVKANIPWSIWSATLKGLQPWRGSASNRETLKSEPAGGSYA